MRPHLVLLPRHDGTAPLRRAFQGFSLIEVLVAVIVVSVGLLGVAKLHAISKRTNLEAVQLTHAAVLAQDLLERMRSNPLSLAVYTSDGAGRTITGAPAAPGTNCGAVVCTDVQVAAYDLAVWWQTVSGAAEQSGGNSVGGLVAPTACITGASGGSGRYRVALAWRSTMPLSNPAIDACGQGSGLYDLTTGAGTQPDVYRRVIVITAHIAEPT